MRKIDEMTVGLLYGVEEKMRPKFTGISAIAWTYAHVREVPLLFIRVEQTASESVQRW
jgi:hypothetical protein